MKIKLPPDYREETVDCPRCHRTNRVPVAEIIVASAALEAATRSEQSKPTTTSDAAKQVYRRRRKDWESFRCTCGEAIQLSPAFTGTSVTCSKCGAVTAIEPMTESRSSVVK